MLFLLFVYYLAHSIGANPIDSRSFDPNSCTDLTHCRTIWNIIWSCLVTIFSCTWVSVHPNIPRPKRREARNGFQRWIWNPILSFAEHRLPLFVCALLVPEYMFAWAIRQYLRAREMARDNEHRQWSMTHAFFIIMGGFHLFERSSRGTSNNYPCVSREDDKPLYPLKESDLSRYSKSFTMPTEAEIKDKGKSDWLAKSIVLIQTSWFVMQCIARAVEHLPVTHLEIVTLAYAAMNFVIYVFWWNKPLNVNRPVRVFRKSYVEEPTIGERRLALENRNPIRTILMFIGGYQDENVELSREDRVPRFWADHGSRSDFVTADRIVLGVGVCFGAIHCIAWDFSFPTHVELLIWRISSIAITAVPTYIFLTLSLGIWLRNMGFEIASGFATFIVIISIFPAGVLYILARAVTLGLAFTSLRDLPPGVFETVHWTTFIPHV